MQPAATWRELESECVENKFSEIFPLLPAAFLSAYADIALSNLLGTVGLPACSSPATLTATLMFLLTGSLAAYRIPTGQVMAPEHNLRSRSQWEAGNTTDRESTDV